MATLVLRVCDANGNSYGGFKWPLEVGARVEAPDWDPTPCCGNGLHGWLHGEGHHNVANIEHGSLWFAVEPEGPVVNLDGKVKFPAAIVRFVGSKHEAAQFVIDNDPDAAPERIIGLTRTGNAVAVGHRGTATAGHRGTATAGDGGTATAGDYGTATAGYRGTATAGHRGTATAGYRGTATAGHRGTATAGYGGTATAGDGGTATAGYRGTATAGDEGTATAGDEGIVQIRYYDGSRYRILTGYVGEDGIEPHVPYHVVKGQFVRKNKHED